jgi:hypothetical protein
MIASPSALIITAGGSGSGGGGGSTHPGGSPTQLQFNTTVFGGVVGSSVDPSTGNITLAPTSGTPLNIEQLDVNGSALNCSDAAGDDFQIYLYQNDIDFAGFTNSGSAFDFNLNPDGDAEVFLNDSTNALILLRATGGVTSLVMTDADASTLTLSPTLVGFFSATPVGQQAVTGVTVDPAVTSLLTALVNLGLITYTA